MENDNQTSASIGVSFSRYGKNLDKTLFQKTTHSINENSLLIQPISVRVKRESIQSSLEVRKKKSFKLMSIEVQKTPEVANWLFRKVGRQTDTYQRGKSLFVHSSEMKYTPKFDQIFAQSRSFSIKPPCSANITPQKTQKENISLIDYLSIEKSKIPGPTPLKLQTNRPPITYKQYYDNQSFFLTDSFRKGNNKSHSFDSYLPHKPILGKSIAPEYDIRQSFNKTQKKNNLVLNFGLQNGQTPSKYSQDKHLNTNLLDYDQTKCLEKLSHTRRAPVVNLNSFTTREQDAKLPRRYMNSQKEYQYKGASLNFYLKDNGRISIIKEICG